MIILLFQAIGVVFVIRLFFLQVLDNQYKLSAENNVIRYVTLYPSRGKIFDRKGKLLVYNETAYDLKVIPSQVKEPDTALLCNLLNISKQTFDSRLQKAKSYSWYRPSTFLEMISKEDYGFLAEKLYEFPGFYVQARSLRKYPEPIAAHLLGSIGEVNQKDIEDYYYKSGDYIGKSGIELYYEKELRGEKGLRVVMVDVFNREQGSFANGRFDTMPVPGNDLVLSIDAGLQLYGESLMQNKTGSIVAIDPANGEILCMVSSPAYDPNLLVGRPRGREYERLLSDSLKPLINRSIMGTYPPGSTFKMINGIIALQEGAIHPGTLFSCQGELTKPIRCSHDHISPLNLYEAIQQSCNPYFWKCFRETLNLERLGDPKIAYQVWYEHVKSFGIGQLFQTDIPFEQAGNLPNSTYFDEVYKGSWNALTVRSLAIGQGELLVTPLQLANLSVIIGNGGYYYPPHLVTSNKENPASDIQYEERITSIRPEYFQVVRNAMKDVFEGEHGTARWYRLKHLEQAGKTGTVQNPHGDDHSLFMAFAPFEKPAIAISVIVENSGFGSTWAAPIASLMMEYYNTDSISRPALEKRMLEGNLHFQTPTP